MTRKDDDTRHDPETGEIEDDPPPAGEDRQPRRVRQSNVGSERLRSFVERLERLNEEKKALADDIKAVNAEAKAEGYDTKIIKAVLKIREMGPADYQEGKALLDMYLEALDMSPAAPLFRATGLAAIDPTARDLVLEHMAAFVPPSGSGHIEVTMGGKKVRLSRDLSGEVQQLEVREEPPGTGSAAAAAPPRTSHKPPAPPPDVNVAGAEELGRQAARENVAVIKNPFLFGTPNRAAWDKGWREEAGNDGMGPGG